MPEPHTRFTSRGPGRAWVFPGSLPAIWVDLFPVVTHLEVQVGAPGDETGFAANTQVIARANLNALAAIKQTGEFLIEGVKVPVDGFVPGVCPRVMNDDAVTSRRIGEGDAIRGGDNRRAGRAIRKVVIVAVMRVIRHRAAVLEGNDEVVPIRAAIHGRIHMVEIGRMNDTHRLSRERVARHVGINRRPRKPQEPTLSGGRRGGRRGGRLSSKRVLEQILVGLLERRPLALGTAGCKKALYGNQRRILRKR